MRKQLYFPDYLIAVGLLIVLIVPGLSQDTEDDDAIWESFKSWVMSISGQVSLKAYKEKLAEDGLPDAEIKRQLKVIQRIFTKEPEKGIELTYDRIFSKPLTGDPEIDGFTSTPSAFMMESTKELEPGTALDVGAGQGRNAVWLAQQGWDVTGIDISGIGLAAAEASAESLGMRIKTVKTTYQEYDFGEEQWDLIIMILSWAPVSDPDFIARLHASLRPGGTIVFEHVLETERQSFPPYVQALPPNALLDHFKTFHIQKYEEGLWQGDWAGPPADLVRLVARKK